MKLIALCLLAACSTGAYCAEANLGFRLPAGFTVEILVDDVPNARSLALGDDGTLFVATRRLGKVYAVRDALTGEPQVLTIADGLKVPNGIAFHDGALYVAELSRLLRFPDIEARLVAAGESAVMDPEVIDPELPVSGKLHQWKYLAFGPDGKLYISLGAPCNICDAPDMATILRMNADGSEREVFARGVRNSVGFDWHPATGEMWFTDNGRDLLGDEIPPCELNRVSEPGQHFGYPFCHGSDIVDPKFGELGRCDDSITPIQALGPHVAPLGMRFYTGSTFPSEYANQVFIAEHGSWNRSKSAGKTGYRLTLVRLSGNVAVSYEPFMEGFLGADDQVIGRPVDILIAPDGALLVSDDQRGVVYRISYDADRHDG